MADTSKPTWEWQPYTKIIHRSSYPAIDSKNPANSAEGKVVVVTGGGTSIGRGVATSFVQAGARIVAIIGRRSEVLESTKAGLEELGSAKILTYAVDILDEPGMNAAFEDISRISGSGIDVVVASAGLGTKQLATAGTVASWWKVFEVNIKGTFITFRAFAANKSAKGTPTFISINSNAAHLGAFPEFSAYVSAKMGLAHLLPPLQVENPDLRIVSIHPGVIESEMNADAGFSFSKDNVNLPGDFALWLASPAAAWTAGKFLWSHWDVEELAERKDEITAKGELTMGLKGWPREVEVEVRP
nr:hypothetical protein B0A51_17369 [Rachicladosporium sp. CCFEE 5018]